MSNSAPDIGDTAMNMSDEVPGLVQIPLCAAYSLSHPPDPISPLLCIPAVNLCGLYHLSSSPSGFLIKLQRIYWRGCSVNRVQKLEGTKRSSGSDKEGSGCLPPQPSPCLICLSYVPQPKAIDPIEDVDPRQIPLPGPQFPPGSCNAVPSAGCSGQGMRMASHFCWYLDASPSLFGSPDLCQ